MSFWDNVKKFAQPYADDDYDDYDDEEMDEYEDEVAEPAPRSARRASAFNTSASTDTASDFTAPAATTPVSSGFSGQVLNMSSGKQEVVLFHAKAFDDAAKAADALKENLVVTNVYGTLITAGTVVDIDAAEAEIIDLRTGSNITKVTTIAGLKDRKISFVIDTTAEPEKFAELLKTRLQSNDCSVIIARRPCILGAVKAKSYEDAAKGENK